VDRPSDPEPLDHASADEARRRLRAQGIVAIEPDERIGVMLAPGERVVAIRRDVSVERRKDVRDPELALRGDLYVTTTRIVCLGQVPFDVPLAEVREAVVAADALRLIIGDGRGLEIRTDDPALLRVEISVVREAARLGTPGLPDVVEEDPTTDPGTPGP
jgi:hypothetical protein